MKYSLAQIIQLTNDAAKARRLSPLTAEIYIRWIKRFIGYCQRRGVENPGEEALSSFIIAIVTKKNLSGSTQNQALNALLFYFRYALREPISKPKIAPRALIHKNVPTSLSDGEIERLFSLLPTHLRIPFKLMYGCGLRIGEVVKLRVQDLRMEESLLFIRFGKGKKDRLVRLPKLLLEELVIHLRKRHAFFSEFVRRMQSHLSPDNLAKRWANEPIFISGRTYRDETTQSLKFSPLSTSYLQRVFKATLKEAEMRDTITPHALRHTFATFAVRNKVNLRELQEVLGHADPNTTAKYIDTYTSVKNVISPLDLLNEEKELDESEVDSKSKFQLSTWFKQMISKRQSKN